MKDDEWIWRMKPKRGQQQPPPPPDAHKDWQQFHKAVIGAMREYAFQDVSAHTLALLAVHPFAPCHYMMQLLRTESTQQLHYARSTWSGGEDYPKFFDVMQSLHSLNKATRTPTIIHTVHPIESAWVDAEFSELLTLIATTPFQEQEQATGIDGLCFHLFWRWGNKNNSLAWYEKPVSSLLQGLTTMMYRVDTEQGYTGFGER